jgi:hypothetical protein
MKVFRGLLFGGVLLLASSCNRYPESYPPPEQFEPPPAEPSESLEAFIEMGARSASSHIVSDIHALEADQWRWTGQRPTLRFQLSNTDQQELSLDFVVVEAAIQQTGPITVTFLVNDRVLEEVRYDTAGEKHFEKHVPPEWISLEGATSVSVSIDKTWRAPNDERALGVILLRAGFLDQ